MLFYTENRLSESYLSIKREEIKLILYEFKDNIFEQFYADNCELYKEVSQKVLTLHNQGRKK